MDRLSLFMTSVGFGLAVAAPVGPMAVICMRRTIALGWWQGVSTGAGIAVGDGIYAAVAAFGLAGISAFLLAHSQMLHFAAGCFLLYLGLKPLLTFGPSAMINPGQRSDDAVPDTAKPLTASAPAAFVSSVLLTLTNPPTIIMFASIFAALAPKTGIDAGIAATTVAGVVTGSLLWWCSLIAGVTLFRRVITARLRRLIDRVVGVILLVFAAIELGKATSS